MTDTASPQFPQPEAARPETSSLAIWSLVCGILTFCAWFITGVPALILGFVALVKINRSGGALGGRNLAIAGLVTGGVGMVAWVMIGVLAIAVPGFVRSRQLAQGRALINDPRAIDVAIDQWALENGLVEGVPVNSASVSVYIFSLKRPALAAKVAALGTGTGSIQDVLPFDTITIGNMGSTQVRITQPAKDALPAVSDWGNY